MIVWILQIYKVHQKFRKVAARMYENKDDGTQGIESAVRERFTNYIVFRKCNIGATLIVIVIIIISS